MNEVLNIRIKDLEDGYGSVYLPFMYEKKYPKANLHKRVTSSSWH